MSEVAEAVVEGVENNIQPDAVAEATESVANVDDSGTKLADSISDADAVEAAEVGLEPPVGAPEFYGDFDMPEGFTLAEESIDGLKALAKELNLPQNSAQKIVDFQAKLDSQELDRIELQRTQELQDWERDVKRDKDLGGGRFHDTMVEAKRGFQRFGTPGLAKLVSDRGIDGHLEFVRLFSKLDRYTKEDSLVQGQASTTGTRLSDVDVFFPGNNK